MILEALFPSHPVLALIVLAVLVLGASLRLARFLTTDKLGGWLLAPLDRWADRHERIRRASLTRLVRDNEGRDDLTLREVETLQRWQAEAAGEDYVSWQARIVSGATCPFCWGFWAGLIVIALTVLLYPLPVVGSLWVILLAALAMNYVVGHLSNKLDA